jgi:hypothetical protein
MIRLTFDIPDEINALIKTQGYDVEGYINQFFIRPLVDQLRTAKREALVKTKEAEIEAEIETIRAGVTHVRKDYTKVTAEKGTGANKETQDFLLETDQQGNLIEQLPAGWKTKKG